MRLQIGDIEMAVESAGDAGPVFLLVHGLGGSSRSWSPLLPLLAQRAVVHAVDLRGCGSSTRGVEPWTLARAAADVDALAEALGLGRYIAVGHSLGGVIVQELLLRRPPALAAAVLISTSSKVGAKATENWQRIAEIVEKNGVSDSPAAAARGYSETFAAEHPEVVAEHAKLSAMSDRRVYAEQARAASSYDYGERLAGVEVPVLVLQGLGDRLTPPGGSVLLHRALPPSARLEMVEGAGHNMPVEAPARVAELLLDFAARVLA